MKKNGRLTTKNRALSDIVEQIRGWGLLHADVGEEFLASILQAGPKDVDYIVDDEKAVVIALAVIDSDRGILLVMTLDVKLQLSQILQLQTGVDSGSDIEWAFAKHGQRSLVDVVVYKHDGLFRLFDKVDNMHVGIEDLAVVENAFHWWQGRTDEEIDFTLYLF